MHTSKGRRVRDSWRLRETKETGEIMETYGYAHFKLSSKEKDMRDNWRLRRLERLWTSRDNTTDTDIFADLYID